MKNVKYFLFVLMLVSQVSAYALAPGERIWVLGRSSEEPIYQKSFYVYNEGGNLSNHILSWVRQSYQDAICSKIGFGGEFWFTNSESKEIWGLSQKGVYRSYDLATPSNAYYLASPGVLYIAQESTETTGGAILKVVFPKTGTTPAEPGTFRETTVINLLSALQVTTGLDIRSIAIDGLGRIYAGLYTYDGGGQGRIIRYAPSSNQLLQNTTHSSDKIFGGTNSAYFIENSSGAYRLFKIDREFNFSEITAVPAQPRFVVVDGLGNLIVAVFQNDVYRLYQMTPDGTVTQFTDDEFLEMSAIAITKP